MDEQQIVIGSISGFYGVKGWVKVFSHTRPKQNILDYPYWIIQSKKIQLEQGQLHSKGIVAKLVGFDDRDAANALLRQDISIPRSQLPPAQQDEYYWVDLVGLQVTNCQGIAFGEVHHLLETGANDVLVIQNKQQQERLIPLLIGDTVLDVNLEKGTMQVDWDADF